MALLSVLFSSLPQTILILLAIACLSLYLFLQPPREPKHIPSVPFWVTLLPLFKDVDQQVIFNTYIRDGLQRHGAIKIFFGSQWNVLIQKPAFLTQIFKHEDQYQKRGNQKKIPGSVLASFLGDNIISSHGDVWKLYQDVMKPGLQEGWSIDGIHANASLLLSQYMQASGPLAIQESLQRYTIANLVQVMLRLDIDMNHEKTVEISRMQNKVKGQIFRPFFMSFPILDSLGLASREKARQDAAQFTDHLVSMLEERWSKQSIDCSENGDERNDVGHRLVTAYHQGRLTRQQLRDNVTIVFVAGQENPQLALLSTLYLLAKHPEIQDRLREEAMAEHEDQPGEERLRNMPLLTSCIYESLRLMPPIGQLINRLATTPLVLGDDIVVPEGMYLGYNSYATNRDPETWGKDADEFVPGRWGDTSTEIQTFYRKCRARAELITFHGGRRACLGDRFAVLQLKVTVFTLVRHLRWKLDPSWPDRMTPVSPDIFPSKSLSLSSTPWRMNLTFRRPDPLHLVLPGSCSSGGASDLTLALSTFTCFFHLRLPSH